MQTRRPLRLKGYDYSQCGAYFVTICAHRHAELFGTVSDGVMMPNAIGKIVAEEWQRSAKLRPNVELDAFVVMPNHIHGIIVIHGYDSQSPDQVVLTDIRKPVSKYLQAGSLGAIVGRFKGKVSRRVHGLPRYRDLLVWQRNYYDHIIRNDRSLQAIREYIVMNPARWTEDSYYSENRSDLLRC